MLQQLAMSAAWLKMLQLRGTGTMTEGCRKGSQQQLLDRQVTYLLWSDDAH